jgi:hypothetical protein
MFLRLLLFSWAIAHSFWVAGWFTRPTTLSSFLRGVPKNCHFCILGPFSRATAHSFGDPEWFTRSMTLNTCLRDISKICRFCISGPFSWAIVHCLGLRGDLRGIWQSVHFRKKRQKNLSVLHLWPFLWAIAYSFGLPGWFTRPTTLSTCLRGMT